MMRREETNAVGVVMKMNVEGKRGRGTPKILYSIIGHN
jgi:hypothetical protein